MSKDPTPKADGLRAMREETRGHLQAHVVEEKSSDIMRRVMEPPPKKLIPYAGKDSTVKASGGGIPYSKNPKPDGPKPPRKRVKHKRKIV